MLTSKLNTGSFRFQGQNVKFSPYSHSLLAVAAAENFGISGRGQLLIYDLSNKDDCGPVNNGLFPEGLFDLTWSEVMPNCIVTGAGNGQLQMWNTDNLHTPVKVLTEHCKDVRCVEWIQTREAPWYLSSSWDGTIKIWDPNYSNSVITLCDSPGDNLNPKSMLVYSASWSPLLKSCIASVSGDGSFMVWNPKSGTTPALKVQVTPAELLGIDWNKYNVNQLSVASTDGHIYVWDLRNSNQPFFVFEGHPYGTTRVKHSPYLENQLASSSYDFTTRLWDYTEPNHCIQTYTSHTEFVYGLDYSTHIEGLLADCSWDCTINIYNTLQAK